MERLKIHETFQSTIQGEGFHAGLMVDFIRLWGCNVGCAWCDTGYADGGSGIGFTERTIDSLISELKSEAVVISGGEPFLNPSLSSLCLAVLDSGRSCHVETSGTFWREIDDRVWVTLSPKNLVSAKKTDSRFYDRANEIKIVVSDGTEYDYYNDETRGNLEEKPCYLQPEWERRTETLPLCLQQIKANPTARLSVQMHKLIGVQ